jgi:ceramide glucosyltransferase
MSAAAWILLGAAAVGVAANAIQVLVLWFHLRGPVAAPRTTPGVSILKPLCGLDDGLEENLASFAALDWPAFEVVLGVQSVRDRAYPLARAAVRRWPGVFRVMVQRGAPGLNPKVNQLLTLVDAARHDLLVVSDSNVRVSPGYLRELVAHLEDDRVGLVTSPIAAEGEERLGSRMDHLHLMSWVTPALVAAKRLRIRDIVVGKSMAFRRADLEAIGGFAAVKDVLAEDYVIGQATSGVLHKEVVVARTPVANVSARRGLREFVGRYERWAVLQRHAVGRPTYACFLLQNPVVLATAAALLARTPGALGALAGTCAAKMALDARAGRLLRPGGLGLRALAVIPAKDLVFAAVWALGLFGNEVSWRGTRIVIGRGTRIVPPPGWEPEPEAGVASARSA